MKAHRKDTVRTRKSLLKAAGKIFAVKGFHQASLAEICDEAGVNAAAVNYHFGGKENLYVEAWKHAFEESLVVHPSNGGVPETAPPEERLKGRLAALLRRVTDEENREFHIAQNELASPTGLLDEILSRALEPLIREMDEVISEILGPLADKTRIEFCRISLLAQCFNPMTARKKRPFNKSCLNQMPRKALDVEAFIQHVTDFSLAGINEIKRKAEKASENGRYTLMRE